MNTMLPELRGTENCLFTWLIILNSDVLNLMPKEAGHIFLPSKKTSLSWFE